MLSRTTSQLRLGVIEAASEVSIHFYLTLAGDSVWLELVTTATKTLGSLIWYVSALLPTKVIRTFRVRRNFNWRVHGHRAYKDKIHIISCWKDFKGYWGMQCAGCKDFVTVVIVYSSTESTNVYCIRSTSVELGFRIPVVQSVGFRIPIELCSRFQSPGFQFHKQTEISRILDSLTGRLVLHACTAASYCNCNKL